MKKVSLLAASVTLALVGCGSESDSGGTPTPSDAIITAMDGYLENAEVWIDSNNDFKLNANDTKLNVLTDEHGQFTLPSEYKNNPVFIKAIAGKTIDKTRGLVNSGFVLATTAGSTIVNPMTNMVIEQLEEANNTGVEVTQKEAEAKVMTSVTSSGLDVTEELLFGDYIADKSNEAQALNVIGETLVDNSMLSISQQLELTNAVANQTKTMIDAGNSLNDLSPVVTVPTDGSPILVTPNSRPTDNQNGTLKPIVLMPGSTWADLDISSYFFDADGDVMSYTLKELNGNLNGLSIDKTTGIIQGKLIAPGTFDYQVFAEDTHGSLSYPLNVEVTLETENQLPIVDYAEYDRLQNIVDKWQLEVGVPFEQTLNIENLFTDPDGNIVQYRTGSMTIKGLTISPQEGNNPIITISGTPIEATATDGSEAFNLGGVDNDGAAAYQEMLMPPVKEGTQPPIGIAHPLENQFLHFAEIGNNGTAFESAWCDSIYFHSADMKVYYNRRTDKNKNTCTPENLDNFDISSSYTVENGKIITEFASFSILETSEYHDKWDHYLVQYAEANSTPELYSYYKDSYVIENEMINHPTGSTMNNAPYVSRMVHTNMNNTIGELDISGIVQRFEYIPNDKDVEPYYVANVSLHGGTVEECTALMGIYASGLTVHGSDAVVNNYFNPTIKTVLEASDDCYLRLDANDSSVQLPDGRYTIEVQPDNLDEGERILFSFTK